MPGTMSFVVASVSPMRSLPLSRDLTSEMIGMRFGCTPSCARTAGKRSWSSVPNSPPIVASLNEPKVESLTMASALALFAPKLAGPTRFSGCPKARARPPQTYVVVPMPPAVMSP